MKIGILRKLRSKKDNVIQYHLPIGDETIDLNQYIGKPFHLEFTGNIYCLDTHKKLKKTYGQGYSWESYVTLAKCDQCILRPHLCHYALGTCREPEWGEKHCLQPHIIYLSLTSDLKVGITRKTQIPTRWIDQGAVKAIKLAEVKDRLTSGKIEVELAKKMSDKTNWRNMLKNEYQDVDLIKIKKDIIESQKDLLDKYGAKILDDEIYEFNYPVESYPQKISAFNFHKSPLVGGILQGIKGQYLIFDKGVINIRKFQGYEVKVES